MKELKKKKDFRLFTPQLFYIFKLGKYHKYFYKDSIKFHNYDNEDIILKVAKF